MNWMRKLLGRQGREYRGRDYSVRIEPIFREAVAVIYEHKGSTLRLNSELCGRKWEAISVLIPEGIEPGELPNIVADLRTAFEALGYGYVIARNTGIEIVPEAERHGALAELHDMGFEIETLPDGTISQRWREGITRPDIETIKKATPRIMRLIQSIHGKRQLSEILAKSQGL